jgi:GNAT superfamily N-acetyltransferase
MPQTAAGFVFSRDKSLLSLDRVCELLAQTYWAQGRSREKVQTSIDNSLCFGIYEERYLIGFARAVTDYATVYWVSDVIIDPAYRGKGLGTRLVEFIIATEELRGMKGILATRDAHGLYEKCGFVREPERFMIKNV